MKTYGEVDVYIHIDLISALVGGEWSASFPGRFTPGGKCPRYLLDRRLGGPQSRSGRGGEETIFLRYRDSNSNPSVVQLIAGRYTDCTVGALTSQPYGPPRPVTGISLLFRGTR
jgi:hypothetical protein